MQRTSCSRRADYPHTTMMHFCPGYYIAETNALRLLCRIEPDTIIHDRYFKYFLHDRQFHFSIARIGMFKDIIQLLLYNSVSCKLYLLFDIILFLTVPISSFIRRFLRNIKTKRSFLLQHPKGQCLL